MVVVLVFSATARCKVLECSIEAKAFFFSVDVDILIVQLICELLDCLKSEWSLMSHKTQEDRFSDLLNVNNLNILLR